VGDPTLNPLIPHWFGPASAQVCEFLSQRSITRGNLRQKISLANFSIEISLSHEGEVRPVTRRAKMAWKTPKIVEVPVGMEINMYMCAARK
jgi:coenzyme PQQ precursor peptide PqqA